MPTLEGACEATIPTAKAKLLSEDEENDGLPQAAASLYAEEFKV